MTTISQCDISLDFQPISPWPQGLPAVAINQVVIAGFQQDIVFNHTIPATETENVASMFRSVHNEFSFTEMARLIAKAEKQTLLPIELIAQKYGWQANEAFYKIAKAIAATPMGFQNWCSEKKLSPMDLAPLISGGYLNLNSLFHDIVAFKLSKSTGTKVLELGIELLLLGKTNDEISAEDPNQWLEKLQTLRYPQSSDRDSAEKDQMISLPWPGMSQAKWTRQGDKTGVELKLFVSQPADLKKYLQSLEKVKDLLENLQSGTQH